ncbi:MAG: putative lipid II flippase FtsW [Oscillospiraceae bacterium]|nr:putative lipid II flippase FtsW [Oscillospiraceae bacterium]
MEYSGTRLTASYVSQPSKQGDVDFTFLALTSLLLTVGVIMVLSASFVRAYYTEGSATYYFVRQLIFAVTGVVIMLTASRFPISFYRRLSYAFLAATVLLLLLVLFVGVGTGGGVRRWLNLGFFTVQPSEFAKLAVILVFADMICRYRSYMSTFQYGIVPFAAVLLTIGVLLVLQPHMSATIIIFAIGAVMMFMGGTQLIWFVAGGSVLVIAFTALTLLFPYVSTRITTWLDPWSNLQGDGYQIVQSIYAISSGGLFGLGLGNSRQKYLYLPEEHNDFIFAVVCEELGFVGATIILILFALLICRGFWIAFHCRDRYSFLVAAGISTLLAMQVILNVAVVTNTIPCTGISLPFFSYGGTALWIELGEMGILLSISRQVDAGVPGLKKIQERILI